MMCIPSFFVDQRYRLFGRFPTSVPLTKISELCLGTICRSRHVRSQPGCPKSLVFEPVSHLHNYKFWYLSPLPSHRLMGMARRCRTCREVAVTNQKISLMLQEQWLQTKQAGRESKGEPPDCLGRQLRTFVAEFNVLMFELLFIEFTNHCRSNLSRKQSYHSYVVHFNLGSVVCWSRFTALEIRVRIENDHVSARLVKLVSSQKDGERDNFEESNCLVAI